MANIGSGYDDENGTAYEPRTNTVIYYVRAIEHAEEVAGLLDPKESYGKRGKKGKVKKDWNK